MEGFFDNLENWKKHWKNMPEFVQGNAKPHKTIQVHFSDEADVLDFSEKIEQKINENTKYIYHPKLLRENLLNKTWSGSGNPRYPIFIPTKGRWEKRYTIKMFEKMGVPYTAVIEKQEYEEYAKVVNPENLLVVPHQNKGLTETRNWIWDYAQKQGHKYFWTFDDNIKDIYRLNRNMKYRCSTGQPLFILEEFTLRFSNLYISGMQYKFFAKNRQKVPVFIENTRIYSNMLIKTDIPYRNKLFYNDDTDLCLQVLKDGFCTILHNSFLINKETTMQQKGGMTDFYEGTNNRKEFAEELIKAHPDVVKLTKKFGRFHHQVNYQPFKKNKLKYKKGYIEKDVVNEFGLKIVKT